MSTDVAAVGSGAGTAASNPARKRNWIIALAVGAVVVIALVAGISALGRSGANQGATSGLTDSSGNSSGSLSGSGSDGTSSGSTSGSETTPPGSERDITYLARLSASSTLKGYPVHDIVDGRMNVAWAEGVHGYGRGEWVGFRFQHPVWLSALRVVPGYVKYDSKHNVDRWYSNGRVASARLRLLGWNRDQQVHIRHR